MAGLQELNERGVGKFPGLLGIVFTRVAGLEIDAELPLRPELLAPNGFLHAGSIVTLADTTCGYGCYVNLPEGASGYTTVELKSNHLSTAREGTLKSEARAVHRGRTTQVWDAVVSHKETGKTLALFRCTLLILYPR